ncbi:MAG: aminotransferase class I/II-fold pyridoxal phosphate-dependent enzyme, partial [Bacteroidota bacterium]
AESYNQLIHDHPNLVVMQTFSKAWGLAAIRLGIAYASEEIIHYLNKVKPPYNVNLLTQQAALEALRAEAQQRQWVAEIVAERERLLDLLPAFPFIEKVHDSSANFLLVKVHEPQELYDYLVQHQIIVRNRSNVPLCEGCLRITIGTKTENERLLKVLREKV